MKLEVLRISSQNDSTSGVLFDVTDGKRKFLCYTLEDEYRAVKVKHETRIPEGTYKLTLRSEGGVYPIIRDAILSGEDVSVTYVDFDHVEGKPTPKVKPVKPYKPYDKANAQKLIKRIGRLK